LKALVSRTSAPSQYSFVGLTDQERDPLSGAGCYFSRGKQTLFVTDYNSGLIKIKLRGQQATTLNLENSSSGLFNPLSKRPQMAGHFSGGLGGYTLHVNALSRLKSSAEEQGSAPATLTLRITLTDNFRGRETITNEQVVTPGVIHCGA
jgi:hypothetical protein